MRATWAGTAIGVVLVVVGLGLTWSALSTVEVVDGTPCGRVLGVVLGGAGDGGGEGMPNDDPAWVDDCEVRAANTLFRDGAPGVVLTTTAVVALLATWRKTIRRTAPTVVRSGSHLRR